MVVNKHSRARAVLAGTVAVAVVAFAGLHWHTTHHLKPLRIASVSVFIQGKPLLNGLDYVVDKQGKLKKELEKHGYDLEWVPAPTAAVGPFINEAFVNHSLEFASYGELPSLILNGSAAGIRTRLLLPWGPGDAYLLVPANSSAHSIEDLKGKRLAVHRGRPWELPLLRLLDQHQLGYKDFQLFNINPDAGAAALATGSIDGLVTISPYDLVDKGVAKIIWSTKGSSLNWRMLGGFWGEKSFLQQNPEITRLVVTAYVEAAAWASEEKHRQTFIDIGTRNGAAASVLTRTYDDPTLNWHDRWSPLFSPEIVKHFRETVQYAKDKSIISENINVNELLDPGPVSIITPSKPVVSAALVTRAR